MAPTTLAHTFGAQTSFLMERRSVPSGGGQCGAINPSRGIGEYPSGLFMGLCGLPSYRVNAETAVTPRGHAEWGEGARDTRYQKSRVMFRSVQREREISPANMADEGACQGRGADKRTRAIYVWGGVGEAVAPVQMGPPGRIDMQECVRMKIFEMKVEGGRLVVMVDLSKEFDDSKTGKSIMIASTEGNVSVPGRGR